MGGGEVGGLGGGGMAREFGELGLWGELISRFKSSFYVTRDFIWVASVHIAFYEDDAYIHY